uniref:Uncharacterized protein n=1 Tax=Arundo donax TaxID=35708 RepID=A0A0A8XSL9_ARUDO
MWASSKIILCAEHSNYMNLKRGRVDAGILLLSWKVVVSCKPNGRKQP